MDYIEHLLCKEIFKAACCGNGFRDSEGIWSFRRDTSFSQAHYDPLCSDYLKHAEFISAEMRKFKDDESMLGKLSLFNGGSSTLSVGSGGDYLRDMETAVSYSIFKHAFQINNGVIKFGPMFKSAADVAMFFLGSTSEETRGAKVEGSYFHLLVKMRDIGSAKNPKFNLDILTLCGNGFMTEIFNRRAAEQDAQDAPAKTMRLANSDE